MRSRFLVTAFLIILGGSIFVQAQEHPDRDLQGVPANTIGPACEEPDQDPSIELLEFLMEWETPSGEWISPLEIKHMKIRESKNETPEK